MIIETGIAPNFTQRAYASTADLPAIVELLNLAQQRYGHDLADTVAQWQADLSSPRMNPQQDVSLWHAANGQLAGVVAVFPSAPTSTEPPDAFVQVQAHPAYDTPAFTRHMLQHAEQRLQAICAERGLRQMTLITGADSRYPARLALLDGLAPDYRVQRRYHRMRRPLTDAALPLAAPALPAGFRIVSDQEQGTGPTWLAAWVAMFNDSFVDHYNFHPTTIAEHQHSIEHNPYYVPAMNLTLLAPDDTPVAFCYTEIDADYARAVGEQVGLIGVLGVRRGYRRMGLGRAMLRAGMHCLQAHQASTAMLGVDATNPHEAVQLYTSEGFTITRTYISYEHVVQA